MPEDESSLDQRKATILRAIISDYVRFGEPVASKTLVKRFPLGVSAATVRNEMGSLEDAGYIYQPHTSSGRVPTDAGYRYFVDAWASGGRLGAHDARRIHRFFDEPRWELQDGLRKTAALLSDLTDHAAVVFAPSLDRSVVRHVELAPLSGDRAMVLLVTDSGRVETHVALLPESLDDVQLDHAAEILNRIVVGVGLEKAGGAIRSGLERFPLELRDAMETVARSLEEDLGRSTSERVFLEGTSNILDEGKFADLEIVRQVVHALERRRLLLEMLADALSSPSVSVRIGSENQAEEMQFCSVVTAAYGTEGNPVGSLAVVGPTRMDYRRTIAAVNEVANALGSMLADLSA